MTHGDAVGHGDGAELARRAAGFLDARLADCAWRISAMLQGAASFQQDATPTKGDGSPHPSAPSRNNRSGAALSRPFRDVAGRKLDLSNFGMVELSVVFVSRGQL